jgi:hypothetical protein
LNVLRRETNDPAFKQWAQESVIEHKNPDYRGVHVRIKLGDLTAQRARQLADISRRFSASELRTSVEQKHLSAVVRQEDLVDLYLAGLLTVKACDLIASFDVILYDYLVNASILKYASANVECVYVGKVGGARQTPQDRINAELN